MVERVKSQANTVTETVVVCCRELSERARPHDLRVEFSIWRISLHRLLLVSLSHRINVEEPISKEREKVQETLQYKGAKASLSQKVSFVWSSVVWRARSTYERGGLSPCQSNSDTTKPRNSISCCSLSSHHQQTTSSRINERDTQRRNEQFCRLKF